MMNDGYYIVEYNYKDVRGHIRSRRLMRGTFDLVVVVYNDLNKLIAEKDVHRPVSKLRLLKSKGGSEEELDFNKELEEWRNLKSDTKK